MPSTMGYVGSAPYQPVNYPKGRTPRGYARGLGAGPPAKARSNTIRQAIRKRGRVHGVSVMAQRSPAGSQSAEGGSAHYRGDPPQTSTREIRGLTSQAFPPSRAGRNQPRQGGPQGRPLAGSNLSTAARNGVNRAKRRVTRGVAY